MGKVCMSVRAALGMLRVQAPPASARNPWPPDAGPGMAFTCTGMALSGSCPTIPSRLTCADVVVQLVQVHLALAAGHANLFAEVVDGLW